MKFLPIVEFNDEGRVVSITFPWGFILAVIALLFISR
jgi:hypothetical protein